jgi:hypothetical protein
MNKPSNNDNTKKIIGWNIKELVELPDLDPVERVDLNPEAFDRLLKQKGIRVKVYRSMFCPNVKSIDGGEHNIDCEMCMGSGYIDMRPIETLAFIQNQTTEGMQQPEGWYDSNSVYMSFPRGIELQYFTLVEICDFTDIFYQRVVRTIGQIDRLKYRAQRVNVLLDQNGVEYFQGTDFKLNDVGDIVWKSGKGPAEDVIYSVHYEYPPRFRAITAMKVNRFTQYKQEGQIQHIKMPEHWMLSKEYLVLRRDKDGNEIIENPIPGYSEESPE